MSKGTVAKIMAQRDGLGQVFIQAQRARNGARHLADFQGMREAGTIVVGARRHKRPEFWQPAGERFCCAGCDHDRVGIPCGRGRTAEGIGVHGFAHSVLPMERASPLPILPLSPAEAARRYRCRNSWPCWHGTKKRTIRHTIVHGFRRWRQLPTCSVKFSTRGKENPLFAACKKKTTPVHHLRGGLEHKLAGLVEYWLPMVRHEIRAVIDGKSTVERFVIAAKGLRGAEFDGAITIQRITCFDGNRRALHDDPIRCLLRLIISDDPDPVCLLKAAPIKPEARLPV